MENQAVLKIKTHCNLDKKDNLIIYKTKELIYWAVTAEPIRQKGRK